MDTPIKIGIIGAAGYTGGELLRILVNHPAAEIVFAHSKSNAGNLVVDVHRDLLGDTKLVFSGDEILSSWNDVTVLFLCVGHGDACTFLESNAVPDTVKIIDLSQDFRMGNGKMRVGRDFVYGLAEMNREAIRSAQNVANPGCFASCIQLGLLPLASKGLLTSEVHINATTGSTGAGQSLSPTSHFTWRNNNLSVYKAFEHQHLNEIGQSMAQLQPSNPVPFSFIPQRGSFSRGILAAMYTESDLSLSEAELLYEEYYTGHPFTFISKNAVDLKQVVNTNKCFIHLEKHGNKLLITSVIDNLLKGASGQAVQNMNLLFGLDETTGLKLKANAF